MDKTFIPSKVVPNPEGQAKLILTSVGLQFVKPRFFKVDSEEINRENTLSDFLDESQFKFSRFGTPVFDSLVFGKLKYTDDKGQIIVIDANFSFDTCLLEVNQTKNIVTTTIAGGNGTVKEYIGLQDYSVSITGLLVGKTANQMPDVNDYTTLNKFLNAPVPIPINSGFLDMFGILSLVVIDYKFGQIPGTPNGNTITINCISDEPFEVEYQKNKQFISSGSVPRLT